MHPSRAQPRTPSSGKSANHARARSLVQTTMKVRAWIIMGRAQSTTRARAQSINRARARPLHLYISRACDQAHRRGRAEFWLAIIVDQCKRVIGQVLGRSCAILITRVACKMHPDVWFSQHMHVQKIHFGPRGAPGYSMGAPHPQQGAWVHGGLA